MAVIKSEHAPQSLRGAAFNFEDLTRQAQAYLESVRGQAAELLAQARKEAETVRQQAEKRGLESGRQAHRQLVEQEVSRQMETLVPALTEAVEAIGQAQHDWQVHWEQRAVHLAAQIAARILRRELDRTPEITIKLVQEALAMAAGVSQLRIHLNPADHQALGSQVEQLIATMSRQVPSEIVSDPAISRGGCRVETRHGAIDQQFETQLARIEAELT